MIRKKNLVCLLTHGSGSQPELMVSEVNLHPGQGILSDSQENIQLAGGFSSISSSVGFPLSPTLKLNHDLGSFSQDALARIARADLVRIQEQSYRSYTVEPDSRFCVIGTDPDKMRGFLGIYSGMFEITPLLVSGCDDEIETANELELTRTGEDLTLEYTVRVPVDKGTCDYCGECGPACPENCIDENLFVDFNRCTFCKECEQVCHVGAIDIYGAERRRLQVPAIVVLEGTEFELPEDQTSIYREADLSEFFSNQYAFQVDEVVSWDESLCHFNGSLDRGCRKCLQSCPHSAISALSGDIIIDPIKCEECGACIAACPTGSIQYQRFTDEMFTSYIGSLTIPRDATVVIGNEKALHKIWWEQNGKQFEHVLFLEHPQVKSLSLLNLLYLYASGASQIVLCCLPEQMENTARLEEQVALANSLLHTYCQVAPVIEIVQEIGNHLTSSGDKPFQLQQTIGVLDGENRRQKLVEVLQFLTQQSKRQARIKGNNQLPFGTVNCDENLCTHCFACLNTCKIQALAARDDESALMIQPALCIGCSSCVSICPENALQMVEGATLDDAFFNQALLAEADPMKCKKCGKVFGSKKSFERVMSILASKEAVDTSHFEYCEECRVINLFENA